MIYNNPTDMDKHNGVGWRLSFGYSRQNFDGTWSEKSLYKNPLIDRGQSRLESLGYFRNTAHHNIISCINQNPIHISHIEANDNNNNMSKLHINFVDVHPEFQGKGYADKSFALLFGYLDQVNELKKIKTIDLYYAASHMGGLKVYNRMMNKAGFYNKDLDKINWTNKEELKVAHRRFSGMIKWIRQSQPKSKLGSGMSKKYGLKYDEDGNLITYTGF
jgi:GNAT superfamily N-acetyltransferase